MTDQLSRRLPVFLIALFLALSSALTAPIAAQTIAEPAAPPATPPATEAAPAKGVEDFNPEEEAEEDAGLAIDPSTIELRRIYEALGSDATLWHQHVQTLSNPFFEGRAPGTRGIEVAAEYIEFWFKQYGLEPAFPGETPDLGSERIAAWSSYAQPFEFAAPNPDVKILAAGNSINGEPLVEGEDFVVLGVSGSGRITAPVTFVGYGIGEGEEGYTSFDEETYLTGRIALLLRYEPLNDEGKSRWSPNRFSRHSAIANKLKNLADRGAAAVILVNPPGAVDGKTGLEKLEDSRRFGPRLSVPVVQVSSEVGDRILRGGDPEGRELLAWRKLADDDAVNCVALGDSVTVSLITDLQVDDRLATRNVAGVLRGRGELADQWLVIGAHYDHVGYGYTGAMPQNIGQLHPGADDNASGTAGLLLAVKRLTKAYTKSDAADLRSIMFIAFSAEEAGLIGSKYFVQNSPISANATTLMINMDMIGRMRGNNLSISGTGTAEGFADLLKPHFDASGLKIVASPGGRGPSDHSSFYNGGIPVLFTFTGTHREYHKPTDQGYTVNPQGAVKVIDLVQSIAMDVASRRDQLRYLMSNQPGPLRRTGARVRLGIQPSYNAEIATGVEVEAVADGTAAAEGGVQAGDVLLSWNGEELTGGQKLFELLGKHEPGDRVQLTVQRAEQVLTLEVTLKGREN